MVLQSSEGVNMTIVYITPCLLGFAVSTQAGERGFKRDVGIFSASDLMATLTQSTEIRVVLK